MKTLAVLAASALLTSCAAAPGQQQPISVQNVTLQDLAMMAMIAGVDPMVFLDPAQMTAREKRIMAGVCFASAKVNTQFDAQSEELCGPLMMQFVPADLAPPVPEEG